MFDLPKLNGNWQLPKPSHTQMLAAGLVLSLIFSAYVLARRDVRAVLFSPGETVPVLSADPNTLQLGVLITPTAVLTQPTLLPASDIDTMIAQLQNMQNQLQTTSSLLEQKSLAAGLPPSNNGMQSSIPPEDVAAIWAEINELYQIMQPLMVQLEVATNNSSMRSPSELIALRTKVNTIHQRLSYLLQRVQAAKGQSGMPYASAGQWAYPSVTNQAVSNATTYQQLYQTMTELQSLLQQMQQGTYRGSTP